MIPASDGQLFDYAAARLGIGDYGGPGEDREYWKYRMTQIQRLKASRRRDSRATLANLATVVDYCAAHRVGVRAFGGLVFHLDDALAWRRDQAAQVVPELEVELAEAAALERERAYPDWDLWADMLVRAKGPARAEVLAEWRAEREDLLWR